MDWDRVKAEHIFFLLDSFKFVRFSKVLNSRRFRPVGGTVDSVTVYISDFGAEKLAAEDKKGPDVDLPQEENEESSDESDEDNLDDEEPGKDKKKEQ